MTPVTTKDRQAWLSRPRSEIAMRSDGRFWIAHFRQYCGYCRTKIAAINAAIRAERKAK